MSVSENIKTPYRILVIGAVLSLFEGFVAIIFSEALAMINPLKVSAGFVVLFSVIGIFLTLGIGIYLYILNKRETVEKDNFLYILIASIVGVIGVGVLSHIVILIAAFICYKRL